MDRSLRILTVIGAAINVVGMILLAWLLEDELTGIEAAPFALLGLGNTVVLSALLLSTRGGRR